MQIFLSCVKEKASKRCKAYQMYMPSSLFSKCYKYAKRKNPDKLYILSAKYFLLSPDEYIDPYNKTLNNFDMDEKKEWAEEVLKKMKDENIDFNEKTLFLCGDNYICFLKDKFPNHENLFDGKGIGEILHWLDKENGDLNESLSDFLKNKLTVE